jgi:uncharacterized membrane protein
VRGHRDLERACLAAVACALVAALVPLEAVRILAAVPLTLFLPGYAVIAVAFGANELALPKRLALSVAVSLMVLVLSTFFLNIFPFGLRTASWAVLLPLVVIAAGRGAALRRGPPPEGTVARGAPLPRPQPLSIVIGVLALAIAVAALVLAQKPLPAENATGFSALWVLPADKSEEQVAVGVISNEQDPLAYRLKVRLGSRSKTYRIDLDPGEERAFEFEVPPNSDGRTHVVASLYKESTPRKLYRRVTSWLPRQKTLP